MIEKLLVNARPLSADGLISGDSIAIIGERIVAIGNKGDLLPFTSSKTRQYDMGGMTIIPGLVDAHIHWGWCSLSLDWVDLMDLPSLKACLEQVAKYSKNIPEGTWIRGRGWAQGTWEDTGGDFPTAADLDSVDSTHPIALSARSGHAFWCNSLALKMAGVGPGTADPEGGSIQRDKEGNPTGILFESAMDLVQNAIPPFGSEKIAQLMEKAQEHAWAQGLTGIHDYDRPDTFEAMQLLRERGKLGLRIVKNINDPYISHAHDLGLRSGFGDDWIRIGALKMFSDGAIGSLTARMIDPYLEQPDNYGITCMGPEEMLGLVLEATRRGIPSTIHAIGDQAMREVLDVLEKARAEEQRLGIPRTARRHRIEHVQVVHPDDVHRLAELDIIASMQPIHATSDYPVADRYWGDRCALAYNPRAQLDAGARLAFGSDAPVESFDPIAGIHSAVTRRRADGSPGPEGWYPEARITISEALRAYTEGPAWAGGQEDHLGAIKPGFLADLVVLDANPLSTQPDDLLNLKVLGTMVGGQWRHGSWAD